MHCLEALVTDEKRGKQYRLRYEVQEQYASFLCDETADAFALALLPMAAKSEQDMVIHANVSPKLMFHIHENHTNFLSEYYKKKKISVTADRSKVVDFHGTAFGTGCSLGVDSLTTIYHLASDNADSGYHITHLCYFGCGHLGIDDQETMDRLFWENYAKKKQFADELGLPIVAVNTSLAQLNADEHLAFDVTANFYNASCALAMQKLFKNYAIASCGSVRSVKYFFVLDDLMESSYIPHFSTESMNVILTDIYPTRPEKIAQIVANPLTPRYLDVCIATQEAHWYEHNEEHLASKTHRNCGWCDKCLRTILSIEALGCLEKYEDTFDLDQYRRHRDEYIYKTIAKSSRKHSFAANYELLRKSRMPLPPFARFLSGLERINPNWSYYTWRIYMKLKKTAGRIRRMVYPKNQLIQK